MLTPYERVLLAYLGKTPDQVPILSGSFPIKGVPELEQYSEGGHHVDTKLDWREVAQNDIDFNVKFMRRFPEVCKPASCSTKYPLARYFGPKWGKEITFKESDKGGFIYTKVLLEDGLKRAEELYVPELAKIEGMQQAEGYAELKAQTGTGGWSNTRVVENLVDEGIITYKQFFLAMRLWPEKLHKLLEVMTEYVIETVKLNEDVMGKITKLMINDHSPTFMSREQFEEFWIPYVKQVTKAFSGALLIYHNEADHSPEGLIRLVDLIPNAGFDAFQLGSFTDIGKTKNLVGNRLALVGNIDLPSFPFLSPDEVDNACREVIAKAAPNGGFILSFEAAGTPRLLTPLQNWEAMIESCKKYGTYPISL
jgi:hypothetical protein